MEKEKTRAERYAEKWLKDNGFVIRSVKQYISKTIYQLEKDGYTDRLEVPFSVVEPKKFMKQFEASFQLLKELTELRRQLEAKQE